MSCLAYSIWEKYMNAVFFKNNQVYILASSKVRVLNPTHSKHYENLEAFNLLKSFPSLEALREFSINEPERFSKCYAKFYSPGVFDYSLQAFSSIRYLVETSTQDNRYTLAATSGGRTVNERPCECFIDFGGDVDILSAYGKILEFLFFPLGRSCMYLKTSNTTKNRSLAEFIDRYFHKKVQVLLKNTRILKVRKFHI